MTNLFSKAKEAIRSSHNKDSSHGPDTSNTTQSSTSGPQEGTAHPYANSEPESSSGYTTTSGGPKFTEPTYEFAQPRSSDIRSTATHQESSTVDPRDTSHANEADHRVDNNLSKQNNISSGFGSGPFDKDVHKASLGGYGVIEGVFGSSGPTTSKRFE